jgi:hypothetical protein
MGQKAKQIRKYAVINEAHTTLTLVGCSKPSLKERSQFKN